MTKGKITISKGNIKMGAIPSVSLPAVVTCRPDLPCYKECYARRMQTYRPSVKTSYENNYEVWKSNPDEYFKQVEMALSVSRFFRFHVSGDIPDMDYLTRVVELVRKYPKTDVLMFSKRDDIINEFLDHETIPDNLHILLSAWRGFTPNNPHNLPVCHVRFKDGYCAAKPGAHECGGNCTNCGNAGTGCWGLKRGEELVIKEH